MELRKVQRTYGITKAIIIDDDKTYHVVTTDISTTGICVKTTHILPTFKAVYVQLDLNKKTIQLKGSIRWINEHPEKGKQAFKEMGIAFIDPPGEYVDFIAKLAGEE